MGHLPVYAKSPAIMPRRSNGSRSRSGSVDLAQQVDELGEFFFVEDGEMAPEHAVGTRFGERPSILDRLGFGQRRRPARDRSDAWGSHRDRLQWREPDRCDGGRVQSASELAKGV